MENHDRNALNEHGTQTSINVDDNCSSLKFREKPVLILNTFVRLLCLYYFLSSYSLAFKIDLQTMRFDKCQMII